MRVRVPPGRAGRLWLLGRLGTARRAADLLERKERLLRSEERRLDQLASRTAAAWEAACGEAETWTARAVLVGGSHELRPPPRPAAAELTWQNTMGLAYPSEATCRPPARDRRPSANPAYDYAVAANRDALDTAVQHAAASYAHQQVAAELSATRHRRRALSEHWIPALEEALAGLENRLDELERDEYVRARWVLRRSGTARR